MPLTTRRRQWVVLTQRRVLDGHGQPCDQLEHSYVNLLRRLDLDVVPVPNETTINPSIYLSLPNVSGVVLSGGNSIHPQTYRQESVPDSDCCERRDQTEHALLDAAIAARIPVLGICRGMQFLNVYFGGSLQNDSDERSHAMAASHPITLTNDADGLGQGTGPWFVNSYHKYLVSSETLAPSLRAFAISGDGLVIEGLYHPHLPIAGVQFHPERPMPDPEVGLSLLQAFRKQELFWKPR